MPWLVLFLLVLGSVQAVEDQFLPDLVSMVTKLQSQVEALERGVSQTQRFSPVAFFAGFYTGEENGDHGPFNVPTTIKYKNIQTNVGGAYSADTGVFTSPVRGLYVFHFSVFSTRHVVATLQKNGVKVAYAFDKSYTDNQDCSTRVAVVTLEPGDTMHVELEAQTHFYGFQGTLNSFSGFLLSPM